MKLGDKIRFTPSAFMDIDEGKNKNAWAVVCGVESQVTGTVVQIHRAHSWARVEYELFGKKYYETFKTPIIRDLNKYKNITEVTHHEDNSNSQSQRRRGKDRHRH